MEVAEVFIKYFDQIADLLEVGRTTDRRELVSPERSLWSHLGAAEYYIDKLGNPEVDEMCRQFLQQAWRAIELSRTEFPDEAAIGKAIDLCLFTWNQARGMLSRSSES